MMSAPAIHLSHLNRADGSATLSDRGYTVVGAVNGPVEVQRRDELAEEAVIDVTVRPATGVGGVGERHFESIIQSTLRHVVLVQTFPRTLIQVTLQILQMPPDEISPDPAAYTQSSFVRPLFRQLLMELECRSAPLPEYVTAGAVKWRARQAEDQCVRLQNLPLLPVLLQASLLALLSAAIPLAMTFTCTLVAVGAALPPTSASHTLPPRKGQQQPATVVINPSGGELLHADSTHVLAFSSHGDLLVAESEGRFTTDEWEEAYDRAKGVCCGTVAGPPLSGKERDGMDEDAMQVDNPGGNATLQDILRAAVQERVTLDQSWKASLR